MIEWHRIGWSHVPDGWVESDAPDGVFGPIDEPEASINAGEQSIVYLLRRSAQGEKLAGFTGAMGQDAREPTELEELPEENPDA